MLSYLATVVAQSSQRDLAVVRVDRSLKGERIDSSKLNLPAVGLGDSDFLEPGDSLYIFGFPGIGGDTITFTAGVVSGFTYQRNLGYRAWIKTDATIAGGNSGGTAVSDDGLLIGVPTEFGRGGLAGAVDYVDARPLADTNGDGVLDDKDIAVPMGGLSMPCGRRPSPVPSSRKRGQDTCYSRTRPAACRSQGNWWTQPAVRPWPACSTRFSQASAHNNGSTSSTPTAWSTRMP